MTSSAMSLHEKILSRRQSLDSNIKDVPSVSLRRDFENRLSFSDDKLRSTILVADDVPAMLVEHGDTIFFVLWVVVHLDNIEISVSFELQSLILEYIGQIV